jgi:hypothetical protein
MSISHYSPDKQKENDANFLSACASFQAGNYLEAAKGFKVAYEQNRSKKWFLARKLHF